MQNRMLNKVERGWRILATGFSFLLFALGCSLLSVFLLLLFPLPVSRRRSLARKSVFLASRFFIGCMRALGLFALEIVHRERVPDGGRLVIANHPTLLDAVFLFACFPNATCIVKSTVARNFAVTGLRHMAGYIPNSVDREQMLDQAAMAIANGETLIVFPEGTRSDEEENVHFRRGAAHIALRAGCMVQPVLIRCCPLTLRKKQKWYDVPPIRPRFSLLFLEPLQVPDLCVNDAPAGILARRITRQWHSLYIDRLCQVDGHEPLPEATIRERQA